MLCIKDNSAVAKERKSLYDTPAFHLKCPKRDRLGKRDGVSKAEHSEITKKISGLVERIIEEEICGDLYHKNRNNYNSDKAEIEKNHMTLSR